VNSLQTLVYHIFLVNTTKTYKKVFKKLLKINKFMQFVLNSDKLFIKNLKHDIKRLQNVIKYFKKWA